MVQAQVKSTGIDGMTDRLPNPISRALIMQVCQNSKWNSPENFYPTWLAYPW